MHKDADGFYTAASCESPASIPPCDPSPMSNPATEPPAEDAASPSHPDAGKQQTPHIIQHLTVRNDTQLQTSSSPLSRSRYVYARLGEQRRVVELLDRDGFQVTLADQQADPNSPLFSAKTFEELGLSVDRSGKWWREACSCASWCTDIKISSRASTIWASQNLPRSRSVLFLSCLQTRECNTAILGCLVVAERDSPITSNTRFCSARKCGVARYSTQLSPPRELRSHGGSGVYGREGLYSNCLHNLQRNGRIGAWCSLFVLATLWHFDCRSTPPNESNPTCWSIPQRWPKYGYNILALRYRRHTPGGPLTIRYLSVAYHVELALTWP